MSDYEDENLKRVLSLIRPCYQCSTCAGGCPVFRNGSEMNPRLIVVRLLLGQVEEVFEAQYAWNCCLCLTCSQRCPQGVDLADLLIDLKNQSVREGNTPVEILNEIKMVSRTGMTLEPSRIILKRRKKMKLPEVLHPNLLEIQKIMKATGFDDLLSSNLKTKRISETSEEVS